MKPYTFTMTRTYQTIVEVEADNYEDALKKLSETDIYAIEMEQCCSIDEIVENEEGRLVKDINWKY